MSDNNKTPWHLDRKVPLGIIAAGLITAATMVASTRDVENKLAAHEKELAVIAAQRISERLTALETRMLDVSASLNRIEQQLDRLVESKKDKP